MSPLRLLVDAERLVADYLRADADVAAIVGSRVYTAVPPEPTFPLVRLVRIGGNPAVAGHLDVARIQIDTWGNSKQEARDLAATVLASCEQMRLAPHTLGVVTNVENDLGLTWSPDPDTDRDRYLFAVAVYLHPNPD